jgi:hypothetical protein
MTQIGKYPLVDKAYNVCLAIEECGASEKLTEAVTLASELMRDLESFCENQAGINKREANKKKEIDFDELKIAYMRNMGYGLDASWEWFKLQIITAARHDN